MTHLVMDVGMTRADVMEMPIDEAHHWLREATAIAKEREPKS